MTSEVARDREVVCIDWSGGRTFGVLHTPTSDAVGVCVIMLSSGLQSRVGPGRLYVRAARRFAQAGMHVLRIDLAGVGDSVGENPKTHFDCHDPLEVEAAVAYVAKRFHSRAVILQGLCAGARVALKATADSNVDGVLAWGMPIISGNRTMPQSPEEPRDRISGAVAREDMSRLFKFLVTCRFLDVRWWRTSFPGGRGIGDMAIQVWRSFLHTALPIDPKRHMSPFLRAAERYLADERRALFVYGELDRVSFEEFRDRFPGVSENGTAAQGFVAVPLGTHTFFSQAAQERVIAVSQRWIESQFPSGS